MFDICVKTFVVVLFLIHIHSLFHCVIVGNIFIAILGRRVPFPHYILRIWSGDILSF